MMRVFAVLVVAACPALAYAQARPQVPPPSAPFRGFVTIDGGYQATTNDFNDTVTFRANAEDGRIETDYSVKGGPAFDIAGGAIVWRQLGVGVGVTRFSRSTPTELSASVPHPFFFNRPREVNGDVGGLKREELAVHVQVRGVFPLSERVQVTVFGGPSFFQVKQGVVTDITYADSYPYDEASFSTAETLRAKESTLGMHGGADVGFFFTRQVGIGGGIRFSRASVDLPSTDGRNIEVDAGGLQAGGGLRLRF